MAYPTKEYIIVQNETTASARGHYHSVNISDINAWLKENFPTNKYVVMIGEVYLKMYHESVFGTIGTADINIWLCNNDSDNSGYNILSGSTSVNSKEFTAKLDNSLISINTNNQIVTDYKKIAVYYDSTTKRTYHCELFKIVFTAGYVTYKVNFILDGGGSIYVDGENIGSSSSTKQFFYDETFVCEAIPNSGYRFVKWSDGNTEKERVITVTGDATYTAIFEPIRIYVGTSQPTIKLGTVEPKIYLGTTQIY